MKKSLLLTVVCLLAVTVGAFAQTASFAFTSTSGSYSPTANFSLTLTGTISGMPTGFTANGYSFWLEAPTLNGFNTAISITSAAPIQFTNPTQAIYPKNFTDSVGAESGYRSDQQGALSGDLGYTDNGSQNVGNGTYNLATYNFSLTGAPAGTYILYSTNLSPKGSEISYDNGTSFPQAFAPLHSASYTITIVPEPATWSLMGLGGIGALGLTWLRARRRS